MIELNKVYGVVFDKHEKTNYYLGRDYKVGDYVVVVTEKGEKLGKVVQILEKNLNIIDRIDHLATKAEYNQYLDNLKKSKEAFLKCKGLIKDLGLDMYLVNASFSLDKSQLLFNFTADNRVDFRELAKKLASIYHTRIELRQIGARDKAKEVGGVGICGGELCCLRFLNKIDTISMNMAKDQNLALNPSKINGACGRLLCCLAYEDEVYLKCAKELPKVGDKLKLPEGEAQVLSVDVINHRGKVLLNGERIDYDFQGKK